MGKQDVVIQGIGVGQKLLPFFVQGVETLFGKKTGQTKKQAVMQLFNASAFGVAAGFGLAGDPDVAKGIAAFAPAASSAIDSLASALFPPAADAAVASSQSGG